MTKYYLINRSERSIIYIFLLLWFSILGFIAYILYLLLTDNLSIVNFSMLISIAIGINILFTYIIYQRVLLHSYVMIDEGRIIFHCALKKYNKIIYKTDIVYAKTEQISIIFNKYRQYANVEGLYVLISTIKINNLFNHHKKEGLFSNAQQEKIFKPITIYKMIKNPNVILVSYSDLAKKELLEKVDLHIISK